MLTQLSIKQLKRSFDKTTYHFTSIPDCNLDNKFGIYVHVPFCLTKCSFCPFYKEILNESDKDSYLSAIKNEIDSSTMSGTAKWIYFGGGTPNVLSIDELQGIISSLKNKVHIEQLGIELLPALLNDDYLKALPSIGFNKISIGVESMSKELMKESGRTILKHEKIDPLISTALSYGLMVNTDLMVGIPGQTPESFLTDVDIMASIMPSQITLYPYMNIRGFETPAAFPEPEQFALIEEAGQHLIEKGYNRSGIWTYAVSDELYDSSRDELIEDYVGFGPAAFSTYGQWKIVNPEVDAYLKSMSNGKRMGFVAEKQKAADDWRRFARKIYDLDVSDFSELPGYIRTFGALLEMTDVIQNGILTDKGLKYAHQLTKTVVEALPFPVQNRGCVENYKEYLSFKSGDKNS